MVPDPFDDMDEFFRKMGIDPREFRGMFDDMQKSMEEAFRNLGQDPSKGFVGGFNVRMGPDGKPNFSTFGNKPSINPDAAKVSVDNREPLTDVIEDPASIAITMELPGVNKQDINLHMTDESLEIGVDNEVRKYHKRVKLPAKVDPSTTKATYNNGILDVTVQKVASDNAGVKIDVE